MSSPMALLVQELSRYCRTLPAGSLVVASSDVLLDLCPYSPGTAAFSGVLLFSAFFAGRAVAPCSFQSVKTWSLLFFGKVEDELAPVRVLLFSGGGGELSPLPRY